MKVANLGDSTGLGTLTNMPDKADQLVQAKARVKVLDGLERELESAFAKRAVDDYHARVQTYLDSRSVFTKAGDGIANAVLALKRFRDGGPLRSDGAVFDYYDDMIQEEKGETAATYVSDRTTTVGDMKTKWGSQELIDKIRIEQVGALRVLEKAVRDIEVPGSADMSRAINELTGASYLEDAADITIPFGKIANALEGGNDTIGWDAFRTLGWMIPRTVNQWTKDLATTRETGAADAGIDQSAVRQRGPVAPDFR